ncbi:A-kinase-interacting protein 1 [Oreochromis niloticus]|uniref:A kinase (PRKA) interacting protein 1 n=2 Tax=Oreochromis TaxID=8139 RepID=A0A669EBZ2_ORENI|nr:A-kinase-interacting protein 1 [Oreochromis niloticus]XP_005460001.1 A-kinase-interacting protein 1 [Oreochromis niloticus]XP_005460003.1 A-kinase-interacting protein 1 [Oreochromis niloticus]XP_013119675.1 A-kinase-interacting protein 1 [Oreochromis niloticus]XP_025765095.1 A-kinase-interacting protein 1 [Oreochromis niloticus]XP_025765096.1 A-kinase-interacting protein 1 [Oreochromis niloticus]XP_031587769.1 A-kinase-interacting protein 1 [Oreochromis aureus]XP_031587770.1 A-kinase-inte
MDSQAWLESSLQRSASLGLEVLQRASRRSVDWASTASQNPTMADEDTDIADERNPTELDDAFAKIAEFMAQTTSHCKRFYESGCCTEPSDIEKKHMSRFHTQPASAKTTAALPTRKCNKYQHHVSGSSEDFYIELSPGTYAITASMAESQQQTQLVSVKAGESVNLTFDL